uniref:Uncharacterized protein n=1 Tax=Oryza nivara TaxID=4536 RepID=A0A0E0FIJ4_ORYNI
MAMASERVYVGGSDARGGGGEPVDGANFVFVCVVVGQGRAREREGPAGSRSSSGGGGGGEAARGMSPGSARARAARTAQNTAWRAILLHGGKAPRLGPAATRCERRRRRQSSHGSLAVLCHGCGAAVFVGDSAWLPRRASASARGDGGEPGGTARGSGMAWRWRCGNRRRWPELGKREVVA